jgi:hypothetical protein
MGEYLIKGFLLCSLLPSEAVHAQYIVTEVCHVTYHIGFPISVNLAAVETRTNCSHVRYHPALGQQEFSVVLATKLAHLRIIARATVSHFRVVASGNLQQTTWHDRGLRGNAGTFQIPA